MQDGVSGFSLGSEQQSLQYRGQQMLVNAVLTFLKTHISHAHTEKDVYYFCFQTTERIFEISVCPCSICSISLGALTPAGPSRSGREPSTGRYQTTKARNVPHSIIHILMQMCPCYDWTVFFTVSPNLPCWLFWLPADPRIDYARFHSVAWRRVRSEMLMACELSFLTFWKAIIPFAYYITQSDRVIQKYLHGVWLWILFRLMWARPSILNLNIIYKPIKKSRHRPNLFKFDATRNMAPVSWFR